MFVLMVGGSKILWQMERSKNILFFFKVCKPNICLLGDISDLEKDSWFWGKNRKTEEKPTPTISSFYFGSPIFKGRMK